MFPLLLGVIFFGIASLAKADKATSSSSSSSGGYGPPLPTPPVPPAGGMLTCSSAIAGLPEPLRGNVANALAYGTDPSKLLEAASALDAVAVAYPALAPYASTSAACLRQRANELGPPKTPPVTPLAVPGLPGGAGMPSLPAIPGMASYPQFSAAPVELTPAQFLEQKAKA